MDDSTKGDETINSNNNPKGSEGKLLKESEQDKQIIGSFLGVEITAPSDMKNPVIKISTLVILNIILLVLLRIALNR